MKSDSDQTQYGINLVIHYMRTLFRFAGVQTWVSLFLMILMGLTQGVGLVMLVPFLGLIGLGGTGGEVSGLLAHVTNVFEWFGLPLTLWSILSLYVGIVAIHAALTRYQAVLNTRIIYGFTQGLRNRLYQALCRTEWLCFLRSRASDVTHVLTADLQRVGFATQQMLQLMGSLIIAGVHIAVAFMISIPMTLFALGCGCGFLLLLRPLNRRSHEVGKILRGSMNDLYASVTEHLSGMKIAKSLSLEATHEAHFKTITDDVTQQMVQFTRVNSTTRMYYEIGAAVALAAFFFTAIHIAGMPGAGLLLMVFLFARLLPKFSMIQQLVQRIANTLPSFEAVLEMEKRFEAAAEPPSTNNMRPMALKSGVRLSEVGFRYDKDKDIWAVKNANVVIPAQAMTAIVGPSGAGKSTLADLVLGLVSPEKGEIRIDGHILGGPLLHRWRRSVGYVPQDTFLFHDTIRRNLLWSLPDARDEALWFALELAAADGFVSRMPGGLDTVVGDRGVRLSGGERQRIALARALLRRPSLLLLDEATSSLDSESEQQIQEAINGLHGELTIVMIAHRSFNLLQADHTIVLNQGCIIDGGLTCE